MSPTIDQRHIVPVFGLKRPGRRTGYIAAIQTSSINSNTVRSECNHENNQSTQQY